MKFSFAQKLEMSQVFSDEGRVVPVTKIKLFDDVRVTALFSDQDAQKYTAVQLGARFTKKINDTDRPRIIREFRVSKLPEVAVGDALTIDQFAVGDKVAIQGEAKGKGFAGVVKRHGFHGADATHGTKHVERSGGSIGSGFPQHVLKGRKMPGRDGSATLTLKNIEIVGIDPENNVLMVKGPMPGARGTFLKIVG